MSVIHLNTWLQLLLTMCAYAVGLLAYQRSGRHPLTHPILISLVLIVTVLWLFGWTYFDYQQGNQPLSVWLGPATVALAVPLAKAIGGSQGALLRTLLGTSAAAVCAVVIAWITAAILGWEGAQARNLSMKTTSLPFAVSVAPLIGADLDWVVLAVFCTGIPTAVAGPWVLRRLGVEDPRVLGLSLGVVGHAFGVARATEMGNQAAGFATLGMVLGGCLLSVLVPLAYLVSTWSQ